ncbi:hypothetical protein [Escherichia phage BEK6]|nr:hypothetical protein [Escherichia phage BEK6]
MASISNATFDLALRTGFEPVTYDLEGRCCYPIELTEL